MTASAQLTLRLPYALLEQIRKVADSRGMTLHDLMLFILWEAMRDAVPE